MNHMRVSTLTLLLTALALGVATTEAKQNKGQGKGPPMGEQTEAAMTQAESHSQQTNQLRHTWHKEKTESEQDAMRGLEKQGAKKSEQIQKELDKGSEQGQQARSKRRKWWKFFGQDEEPVLPDTPAPPAE